MKAVINGIEVEGTVKEIQELLGLDNTKPPVTMKTKTVGSEESKPKFKKRKRDWESRVEDVYQELKNKGFLRGKDIAKIIGIKQPSGSTHKLSEMLVQKKDDVVKHKGTLCIQGHEQKVNKDISKKRKKAYTERPDTAKRMRFIHDRCKKLCKYQGYQYEQAFQRAAAEWRGEYSTRKKSPGLISEKTEFPEVPVVHSGSHIELEGLIKWAIGNKGRISFYDIKNTLRSAIGDWDGKLWHEFCAQIVMRNSTWKKYFGVSGAFKIKNNGGYEVLEWECQS